MNEDRVCLVRYGLMGHVGRFPLEPSAHAPVPRGRNVVVRTDRGIELGEVLVPLVPRMPAPGLDQITPPRTEKSLSAGTGTTNVEDQRRVLRVADSSDLENARRAQRLRPERFPVCTRILCKINEGLDLVDVEPLLDLQSTVLYLVGSPSLSLNQNLVVLRARFRSRCDFDVIFEPVEAFLGAGAETERTASRSGCGDCSCSGGGCNATTDPVQVPNLAEPSLDEAAVGPVRASCVVSSGSGCASCAATRRQGASQVTR